MLLLLLLLIHSSLGLVRLTLAILPFFLFSLKCISVFIALKIKSDNNESINNTWISNKYLEMNKKIWYLLNGMERRWMSTIKKVHFFKKRAYQTSNSVRLFHWKFFLDASELITNFFNSLGVSFCIWDMISGELG